MRGAFRHWECPKGEAATQIEITTFRSVDAWLQSTFKAYPAQEVADENLVRSSSSFIHACGSWVYGTDKAVECDERGGEGEKVGAGGQEAGRVGVQRERASSLPRTCVGQVEGINVEYLYQR